MKSFWKKFGNICRDEPDININDLFQSFSYLENSANNDIISISNFVKQTNISIVKLDFHLAVLLKNDIITSLKSSCSYCGELNNQEAKNCSECKMILEDKERYFSARIGKNRNEKLHTLKNWQYESSAEYISQKLDKHEKIGYMIFDISKSQVEQANEKGYADTLQELWRRKIPLILNRCKHPTLPLLSNGDQNNIAFFDPKDCLMAAIKFFELVRGETYRYNITIGTIYLEEDKSAKEYMRRNLLNKWDLNLIQVTILHRIGNQAYHDVDEDVIRKWYRNIPDPDFRVFLTVDKSMYDEYGDDVDVLKKLKPFPFKKYFQEKGNEMYADALRFLLI